MKFIQAEDHEENLLFQRLVSEDGKREMGIYPVIFGYRVRAGYIGDSYVYLDWCGGDDQTQIELLYSIAKNILENQDNFKGIPSNSKIKPFYRDEEFFNTIQSLVTGPLEIIKLETLSLYRLKMHQFIF